MELVVELKKRTDWELLREKLDFSDIRILEQIYIPNAKATTLQIISKELQKYKINKMKISRRLKRLEKFNLVRIVTGTNPLCIWGLTEIERNVQALMINTKIWLGIE